MKERESNFDLLRVICAFAVILLHVACLWVFMDPGDASGALLETYQRNQFIARVYDIMTRFAVPCFVMLSGAFVLANKKNSDFKYFYKKTLKTLAIPTAIFAVLYVIYRLCRLYDWGMLTKAVFFETVGSIFTGHPYAHMWYMYMIVGVYLAMPILLLVKEKVGERNFKRGGVVLLLLSSLCFRHSSASYAWDLGRIVEYSSYAIMGYTIRQWAISRRGRRGNWWKGILLILAGLGIEAVIAVLSPDKVLENSSWLSVSPLAPLIVICSIAIFAGFAILPVKFSCAKTAGWTFMIYLVHMWVLDIVGPERFPEKWTTWNALVAIPAVSVVVFAVSALIAGVYEKIRTLAKAGQLKYAIMNVMKAIEKYLKKYRYLILAFGLTLIFFGIFAKVDYATDTYADIVHSPKVMWAHFLGSGRFVTAVFYALFVKLGLSFKTIYLISFAAAVVALSAAIYVLKKILDKYVKNEILAFVGAAIILINPFTIELFLYAEKGVMVASVLFAVLATRSFVKYLETKKKRNILLAVMWAVLGACSYQGTLGVVVVLMTLVVVLEKKKVSDFIKWTVMSVLIYGGAAVVNLGGAKLLTADGVRMAQDMNLWKTIQVILVKTPGMLGFYKMASVGMIAVVVAIILVAVVVYVVKAKKFKEFGVAVAKIIYLAVVTYLAAVAPQVTQGEEMVWLVARSTYVFGAIIGLAFCVLLAELPKIREEKVISGAFLAAAVVFLATVWMGSMKISIDHYNINALDKERALAIGEIIMEYEEENDVVIKKIGLFPDSAMGYSYKDMMVVGDINISAFATGWSDDPAVNYWNDRRMEEISIDDEAEEYCAARNWDYFEKEQVFFRDDTVFVCKF